MLTPAQFLAAVDHETRVAKHLAARLPPGALDWRPTPGQRSTLELLRYLTSAASVPCLAMVRGHWDDAEALEQQAAAVTPATFDAAMDRQRALIADTLAPLGERDFLERDARLPWGTPVKLGEALVRTVLYVYVAYRMQLFLYAKQSGNAGLGPHDCWAGVDAPAAPSA
ncbi:MAG: DinB family protein [Planctomycetia bacterium]